MVLEDRRCAFTVEGKVSANLSLSNKHSSLLQAVVAGFGSSRVCDEGIANKLGAVQVGGRDGGADADAQLERGASAQPLPREEAILLLVIVPINYLNAYRY
jgi:hypothetical protein